MKLKRWLIGFVLILFGLFIFINETQRFLGSPSVYEWQGARTINPSTENPTRCSWACHNSTIYCKTNHVRLLTAYFPYTDPLYFGVIRSLKATGNYGLANLVVLVVLIPGCCLWLGWKSIDYQLRIKEVGQGKSTRTSEVLLAVPLPLMAVYVYCTDFIINVANLTGLSYYEINFVLFCVVYPLLFVGLVLLFLVQRRRFLSFKGLRRK